MEGDLIDKDTCPKCAKDRGLNKNMVFMVSSCGHKVCEECRERMYGKVNHTAVCHQCKQIVTRAQWQRQRFEDIAVQKEVHARGKYIKEWNKTREDFRTDDDYNDYLEEFEDIIYCIVNNENIEDAKRKLEKNRTENERIIRRNQEKQDREARRIEKEIEEEEALRQERWRNTLQALDQERQQRRQLESVLIEQMAQANMPAEEILRHHDKRMERLRAAKANDATPVMAKQKQPQGQLSVPQEELIPYVYKPLPVPDSGGPPAPTLTESQPDNTTFAEKMISKPQWPSQAYAGGYQAVYTYTRNKQEAYCCLYRPAADCIPKRNEMQ